MHSKRSFVGLAAVSLSLLATPSRAVDDEAAFLEALRDRGYHDLALEYLAEAEDRVLTSEAFRERLAYEQVVTRLDHVRTIKDADQRAAALRNAASSLEAFAARSGDNRLSAEAQGRLATAYVNSGNLELARAAPLRDLSGDDQAGRLLRSARESFEEARRRYNEAQQLYQAELKKYKTVAPDSPEAKQRLELRGSLAQMRLLGSRTLYQQALTYPPADPQYKTLNTAAAEELSAFYEKYSKWLVGLYAHLYEGQSYLALKEYKLASGCFEDLVVQPTEDAAFRRLVTLAHASLAETRLAQGELEPALRDGVRWFEQLRGDDAAGPDAMALAYQIARAAMMLGEGAEGAEKRQLLSQSREWFGLASRSSNEFRTEARRALNQINELLGRSDTPLDTFEEAYQEARSAMTSISASKQAVRIASQDSPEIAREFEAELEDSRRRAMTAIAAALTLIDDSTELAKLNEVRSSLAFLSWETGDYLRAAVIGEFLATQYPEDPSAEQAANLAIASLQRMYQQARDEGGDGEFESKRLASLTESVLKTWPGTRTASGASAVLVSLALRDNRLDDARRVIDQVPAANRPALELQLASAVWEKAVRELAASATDNDGRRAAERNKRQAASLLSEAYKKNLQERPVSPQMATAALYLAQARFDAGRPQEAIAILEDEEVGPLPLLGRSSPATSRSGYAAEAYKLALRGYVSQSPPRTDEALRTMKRLEQAVRSGGGSPAAQRAKLTRVYFGLGVQLQREMSALNERGKSQQARQLGTAFAAFLDRLTEQAVDSDWITKQWIGQTYLRLADGLGDNDSQEQVDHYLTRARTAFEELLQRAQQDPSFAPKSTSLLAARLQLGQAQRKLGEHQQALDTFSSILLEKPASLEVQRAAAYTLQEWGAASDESQLVNAIRGSRLDPKTKKNLVWGWSKLGKVANSVRRKRPEYEPLFYESWLNIATCRYLAAEKAGPGAARDKQLSSARRTLSSMVRNYPELGGAESRKQFDDLTKRIQKLEGSDPIGLKEFSS